MGYIYQRGDRFWISYRDKKSGKRIRRSAGGTRLEELAELRRIEGTLDEILCDLLIADYLERSAAYLKPATLIQYRRSSQRLLDLQSLDMAAEEKRAKELGVMPYPHVVRWLRDQ